MKNSFGTGFGDMGFMKVSGPCQAATSATFLTAKPARENDSVQLQLCLDLELVKQDSIVPPTKAAAHTLNMSHCLWLP